MFEWVFGILSTSDKSFANDRKPAGIHLQFGLSPDRDLQRDYFIDQRVGYLEDGRIRPEQLVQKQRLNTSKTATKLQTSRKLSSFGRKP